MKKILSLVLAIMMVATFALAVSADEVKAGNKMGMLESDGVYTTETNEIWGTCVLGESTNWEVTMTLNHNVRNAEYGLQICGADDNADGHIREGDDSFLQVFLTGNEVIRLIGCDNGWGNVSGYQWDNINRSTGLGNKDELTLTVKLDGKNLSYWVNGEQCGDTIELDDTVMYGNVVTLVTKHTDTSIKNVTFTDHNAPVETPDNPGDSDSGNTVTPVAPKTGEATAVVALVSVLSLAGVVIASKKRA